MRVLLGTAALTLLSFSFFSIIAARADGNSASVRISRPHFKMPAIRQLSTGRELWTDTQLALWHRNYSRPVICSSVICGGSCAAYMDSCPSFTGSAVLDFKSISNFGWDSVGEGISSTAKNNNSCPVNVPIGLLGSNSCGSMIQPENQIRTDKQDKPGKGSIASEALTRGPGAEIAPSCCVDK